MRHRDRHNEHADEHQDECLRGSRPDGARARQLEFQTTSVVVVTSCANVCLHIEPRPDKGAFTSLDVKVGSERAISGLENRGSSCTEMRRAAFVPESRHWPAPSGVLMHALLHKLLQRDAHRIQ